MYADHQFKFSMCTGSADTQIQAVAEGKPIQYTLITVTLNPYFKNELSGCVLLWVADIKRDQCAAPHIVRRAVDEEARRHFTEHLTRRYDKYMSGWRVLLADEYDHLMSETFDRVAGNAIDITDPDAWLVISLGGEYITLVPHAYTFGGGEYANTMILFEITGRIQVLPEDRLEFLQNMNHYLEEYWHNMGRKYRATFKGGIEYKPVFSDEFKAFERSMYGMARAVGER